jgi:hypothetical protein
MAKIMTESGILAILKAMGAIAGLTVRLTRDFSKRVSKKDKEST